MSARKILMGGLMACGLMFLSTGLMSQNTSTVEGTIVDADGNPLSFATVLLLQAKDSIMEQFVVTNEKGAFKMPGVKSGEFLFQITFLGYQNHSQKLSLPAQAKLGKVTLAKENLSLNEFKISEDHVPIKIKNDTIEYNADAFSTQPNAAVEDLLKRLPGVDVDKDGTVSAQGEEVTRVLVDGKEFFGDDPKMATKNLPADAIDKVQVFDKKSDMSEFTGVDDGDRTKTINLLLKDGKKAGYFGNVTGGYGVPNDRFEGKFNVNQFTKKTQFSALGMANNINDQGFSISEFANFMGGFRNLMQSGMANFNNGQHSTSFVAPTTAGITTAYAGGINFNYDISKKTELRSSYFFNRIENELETSSTREYFNNTFNYDSEENGRQDSKGDNHRLNFRLEQEIDSTQDLNVKGNITLNDGFTTLLNNQQSRNGDSLVQNSTFTNNKGNGTGYNVQANLTYRKKLKKPGRSFVAEAGITAANDEKETELNAFNTFFTTDSIPSQFTDTIWQNQDYRNERFNYSLDARYTEPLGKGKYLEFNYRHRENRTNLNKAFFDLAPETTSPQRIDSLSNAYENVYRFDRAGLNFKLSREKYNLTVGARAQQSVLDGTIISGDTTIEKSFFNVLPSLRLDYRFTGSKRIRFSYSGNVNEPSLEQLQPVVDNSNPLQVYVGNPDLQAEFAHRLNFRYISFSQFSFTSLFATINATYTENKIINAVTLNESFVQTSRPINVDQDITVNTYVSYSRPFRPLGIDFSVRPNVRLTQRILFINRLENTSDQWTQGFNFKVNNRKREKVDASAGVRYTRNSTTYSDNEDLNQSYFTSNYYTDITLTVLKNWALSSSFDYTVYTGASFSSNEAIPIWKASLSRIFLKGDRGQIKLSVFDILNQNQGFNRTSNLNFIQEEYSNNLSRYFMCSFTYSLSALGQKKEGGWFRGGRH